MQKPDPKDFADDRNFWAAYRRWQAEQALRNNKGGVTWR